MSEENNNEPLKTVNNGQRDEKGRFLPGNLCGQGRPRKDECLTSIARQKLAEQCPYALKAVNKSQHFKGRTAKKRFTPPYPL